MKSFKFSGLALATTLATGAWRLVLLLERLFLLSAIPTQQARRHLI